MMKKPVQTQATQGVNEKATWIVEYKKPVAVYCNGLFILTGFCFVPYLPDLLSGKT